MSEASKELVRRHFEELWNRRDLAVADELMAEDYLEHSRRALRAGRAGKGERPGGHAPDRRMVAGTVPRPAHDHRGDRRRGRHGGDAGPVGGTNLGPLNRVVPATGRRFVARQSHWFRVENPKLAEHWAAWEELVAMLQLGLVQPPGRPPN